MQPRRSHLVCLALALALGACSRRSSESQRPSASGKASAAPSASSSVARRQSPAPVTPAVPPQLVVCNERDFYRITQTSLQVFEIAAELPPPQIRGSRISVQTNEVPAGEPLNVFLDPKKRVVVLAKDAVYRYTPGTKETQRYAPIPSSAALQVWPDSRRADSFHVRTVGDDKLREYSLEGVPVLLPDAAPAPPQTARQVENLPGFDALLFALLANETPFYSTAKGLVRRGSEANVTPLPNAPGPAVLLFADAYPDRYWAADAAGGLTFWDPKQRAEPMFSTRLPGVVIDSAVEGDRVAVLSLARTDRSYLPVVTIFSGNKQIGQVDTGPSISRQQPQVDLCLIAGKPWVLVGTKRWMQLLDWEARRLLAEW